MKKNQIRKSVAALAMAVVVGVSLLGYGCGSKSASTAGGVSGDFTGTAKGMGGDVTVTLTLEDGKITGCTAEGKDETPGIGTLALEQLPAQIAETGSIAVDGVSTATITSNAIKEAAAAALTAAGLNADDYKIEVKADETKAEDSTVDADVVIVGAGGAGMTAAITAAAEGKSVVIVESQAMVGGIAQHKADAGNHRLALALFDEQTADEGQQQVAHQIAAGGACQLGNARAVAGEHRHAHKADEQVHRHAQGAELGPQQPCGQADDKV